MVFILLNSNEIFHTEHISNEILPKIIFSQSTSQDDAYVDIDVRNSIMTLNYWHGAN